MESTRRDFVRKGATLTGALLGMGAANVASAQETVETSQDRTTAAGVGNFKTPETTRRGDMVYRKLGKTGEEVSLIGLGGFHIGKQTDEQKSIRLVRTAIDRGITFLDNSWDYNDGKSEERMGKALRDGYRQKIFLMTKLDGRTKESANQQLEESLTRLQTDHIDLIQLSQDVSPGAQLLGSEACIWNS